MLHAWAEEAYLCEVARQLENVDGQVFVWVVEGDYPFFDVPRESASPNCRGPDVVVKHASHALAVCVVAAFSYYVWWEDFHYICFLLANK